MIDFPFDWQSTRAREAFRQHLTMTHLYAAWSKRQRELPHVVPVLTPEPVEPPTASTEARAEAAAAPDAPDAGTVDAPPVRLTMGRIMGDVEAYLAAHPETADECALRGWTPGETRYALAREMFGDALLEPLGQAFLPRPTTTTPTPTTTPEEAEPCVDSPPSPLRLVRPPRQTSSARATKPLRARTLPQAARANLRSLRGGRSAGR